MTGPCNLALKVRRKDFHCSVSIIQKMYTKLDKQLHVSLLPALPFAAEQRQQGLCSLPAVTGGCQAAVPVTGLCPGHECNPWVMKGSGLEAEKCL